MLSVSVRREVIKACSLFDKKTRSKKHFAHTCSMVKNSHLNRPFIVIKPQWKGKNLECPVVFYMELSSFFRLNASCFNWNVSFNIHAEKSSIEFVNKTHEIFRWKPKYTFLIPKIKPLDNARKIETHLDKGILELCPPVLDWEVFLFERKLWQWWVDLKIKLSLLFSLESWKTGFYWLTTSYPDVTLHPQ